MAQNQQYRYNASTKEYSIITDFSKGMNTADGDSILTDNTARNVTNFDIDAGAILSKRNGISTIAPAKDYISRYLAKDTISSSNDYIVLLAKNLVEVTKGKDWYDKVNSLHSNVFTGNTQPLDFENLFKELISYYLKVEDTFNASHDIIVDNKTKTIDNIISVIMTPNDKVKEIIQLVISAIDTYNELNPNSTKDFEGTLFDYSDLLDQNGKVMGIIAKEDFFNVFIAHHLNILISFLFNDDGYYPRPVLFNSNQRTSYNKLFNIVDVNKTNVVWTCKRSDAFDGSNTYGWSKTNAQYGTPDTTSVGDDGSWCFKPNLDLLGNLSFNYLGVKDYDLESTPLNDKNFWNKFTGIVDIKTNQSLPNENDITISKSVLISDIKPIQTKDLTFYNIVNFGSNYGDKIHDIIDNPHGKYSIYYATQLITLESWTKQQTLISSFSEYVTQVLEPAYGAQSSNVEGVTTRLNKVAGPSTGTSYASAEYAITWKAPLTTEPLVYEFLFWVIDETKLPTNPTQSDFFPKSISDLYISRTNVNAENDDATNHFNFKNLKDMFFNTDKSLFYKNQIFKYGNSNTIYVSDILNSGYYPLRNYISLPTSQHVVSIVPYYNQLLVQTKNQQFIIEGNTPTDFKVKDLNSDIGAYASLATKPNINYIFQLSTAGVYRTKSTYNFADRYNVDKMDTAISGQIPLDVNASAIVLDDKYYLHTPSTNEIWIFYNQFNSWVRFYSDLFKFKNIYNVNEQMVFISSDIPVIGMFNNEWVDKNFDRELPVISTYKSKEVDFGLPNHDKKFKEMHVSFEDTPKANAIYVNAWVDGSQIISYKSDEVTTSGTIDEYGQPNTIIERKEVETNQIETYAQAQFDNGKFDKALFDNDQNQQHKVILSGRGKALQFEVIHKDNKQMKIRNFATVLKNKKPKAYYKS